MKSAEEILKEAKKTKEKDSLAQHEQTILALREKNYSWRDIAKYLQDRGVVTDHSKIYRFIHNTRRTKMDSLPKFVVPTSERYVKALEEMDGDITPKQRKMIEYHYRASNRTVTYSKLAEEVGYASYHAACLQYGTLGANLGNQLGMTFTPLPDKDKESIYYSSAIGTPTKYEDKENEWMLIMHHELAKALELLDKKGWFGKPSE